MTGNARDTILSSLWQAAPGRVPNKSPDEPPAERVIDRSGLVDAFCERFTAQTGIIHRVGSGLDTAAFLPEILKEHGIRRVVSATGLPAGPDIRLQTDFSGRRDFTEAVFNDADVGLTGADFGVAESGTIVLSFHRDHARLISLAPEIHIALLSAARIVPTFEDALSQSRYIDQPPSHMIFITGPSMTADIQGKPFKGMHGPRKLILILTE